MRLPGDSGKLTCSREDLRHLLVRKVSSRLLLLALLVDQGQTNTPHPCIQQKQKVSRFPQAKAHGKKTQKDACIPGKEEGTQYVKDVRRSNLMSTSK